MVILLSA